MAVQPLTPFSTPEEYLEMEREAEYKNEYYWGQIVAMSGGSASHSKIAYNLSVLVGSQLRGTPCSGFSSDMKVRAGSAYTYPDLTFVCGEAQFQDSRRDVLINPTPIFEVLFPSTEQRDRSEKWENYRHIKSLREYVLVAQDKPRIERYLRQDDGQWLYAVADEWEGVLRLDSVGCSLSLAEVYENIPSPPRVVSTPPEETSDQKE